jgi:hypothetical protein
MEDDLSYKCKVYTNYLKAKKLLTMLLLLLAPASSCYWLLLCKLSDCCQPVLYLAPRVKLAPIVIHLVVERIRRH